MGGRRWTNEELNFLKEGYGKIKVKEMCKQLNKTKFSICSMAHLLDLKSDITALKEINTKISEDMSYILGVVAGDGSIIYYKDKFGTEHLCTVLCVKDKDFRDNFVEKLKNIGGHCTICTTKNGYRASCSSKKLYHFIENFNPIEIKNYNNEIKCSFLRGLYDSEGHISIKDRKFGKTAVIGFTNKNKKLIQLVKDLLLSLDIESSAYWTKGSGFNKNDFFCQLLIMKKEYIMKFNEYVGFSIERKNKKIKEFCIHKIPTFCNVCGKEFNKSQSMILHRRWHFNKYKLPSMLGMKHSEEARLKISKSSKKLLEIKNVLRDENGRFLKIVGDDNSNGL